MKIWFARNLFMMQPLCTLRCCHTQALVRTWAKLSQHFLEAVTKHLLSGHFCGWQILSAQSSGKEGDMSSGMIPRDVWKWRQHTPLGASAWRAGQPQRLPALGLEPWFWPLPHSHRSRSNQGKREMDCGNTSSHWIRRCKASFEFPTGSMML